MPKTLSKWYPEINPKSMKILLQGAPEVQKNVPQAAKMKAPSPQMATVWSQEGLAEEGVAIEVIEGSSNPPVPACQGHMAAGVACKFHL